HAEAKRRLQQAARLVVRAHARRFDGGGGDGGGGDTLGLRAPAGVLLHGPTGCGKSFLARAAASSVASSMRVLAARASELMSRELGGSEAAVRRLFAAARRLAPCVVVLDDIDAIAARREWSDDGGDAAAGVGARVLSTLLNELDGLEGGAGERGVLVVATSARPDRVDDALLRPGRLDLHLHIDAPAWRERRALLARLAPGVFDPDPDADATTTATAAEAEAALEAATFGFTFADVAALAREARRVAVASAAGKGATASLQPLQMRLSDIVAALRGLEGGLGAEADGDDGF
ncbi:hypothetical protein HK405_000596, partial [Cladochytrium tenue]